MVNNNLSCLTYTLPSINLKWDSEYPEIHLRDFYLTRMGASVVEQTLQALQYANRRYRVATLAAPPGSGKSYLALFLTTLLGAERGQRKVIEAVLQRNRNIATEFKEAIRSFLQGKRRLLPLYLCGDEGDLRSAILREILICLAKKTFPNKWHIIQNIIFNLQKNHIEWAGHADIIPVDQPVSEELLQKRIKSLSQELCQGNRFFPALEFLLKQAAKATCYEGFFIAHDEFNRLLSRESGVLGEQFDFLQDLAEFAVRLKGEKLFLLLLTHKGISQYADGIEPQRLQEWLKIEGRFNQILFRESSSDIYSVLSHLLHFRRSNGSLIAGVEGAGMGAISDRELKNEARKARQILPQLEMQLDISFDLLAKGCYPLHLATVIALPYLSHLLGQNERTLYSFLSDILNGYFQGVDISEKIIRISDLFDYFDALMDRGNIEDAIFARWQYGRMGIREVDPGSIDEQILKTVAVFSAINQPNFFPSQANWIGYCLGKNDKVGQKQVVVRLAELERRNLLLYRESSSSYQIHYGSSIDIRSRVLELENSFGTAESGLFLDQFQFSSPIYGNDFNSVHYSSHFFGRAFILEEHLLELSLPNSYKSLPQEPAHQELSQLDSDIKRDEKRELSKNLARSSYDRDRCLDYIKKRLQKERARGAKGLILYLLRSQENASRRLWDMIQGSDIKNELVLIASSKRFNGMAKLRKLAALNKLRQDRELLQRDPLIKHDIYIQEAEIIAGLQKHIRELFQYGAATIHTPRGLRISRKRDLPGLVSDLLFRNFHSTAKINCQLINREGISGNVRNARKKIVRSLLAGNFTKNLGFGSYGPELVIFRCLFVVKNIYRPESPPGNSPYNGHFTLDSSDPRDLNGERDQSMYRVLQEIDAFYARQTGHGGDDNGETFESIYRRLLAPPYGLYSEVLPLYLVAVLAEKGYAYSLYERGRYVRDLNSDVVERLHRTPADFHIRILNITETHQGWLKFLQERFASVGREQIIPSAGMASDSSLIQKTAGEYPNQINAAMSALLGWYRHLPPYTQNSSSLSSTGHQLFKMILSAASPEKLLFEDLASLFPKQMGKAPFSVHSDSLSLQSELLSLKKEIDMLYPRLIQEIIGITTEIFISAQANASLRSSNRSGVEMAKATLNRDHRGMNRGHRGRGISSNGNSNLRKAILDFWQQYRQEVASLRRVDKSLRHLDERLRTEYSTDQALVESLGALLAGEHPRYWDDNTIEKYELRLYGELAKLIDRGGNANGFLSRLEYLKQEFVKLAPSEQARFLDFVRQRSNPPLPDPLIQYGKLS